MAATTMLRRDADMPPAQDVRDPKPWHLLHEGAHTR